MRSMLPKSLLLYFGTKYGRLLLHLLFWMAVAGFLLFFFGHFSSDFYFTFLFVCLLMPVAVGTTYLINYFLIPRYLLLKRYTRFALYFVFLLILSVWANMLIIVWTFVTLANYRYSNMNPFTGDIFYVAVALYLVVFFSSSVKLLRHWHTSQQHIKDLRNQQLEAQLKLKEAELELLKGQIHPHFLFNTLNNLYGLALEHSEQMPDAILRLSGLLDALLYRGQAQQIPLVAELKLLEDYIKLEKLRFEDRLEVSWNIAGETAEWAIAPFLLFPFVENTFKHGFAGDTDKLLLQVKLCIQQSNLLFSVTNSIGWQGNLNNALPGGIGLKNVQKRLDLLYPQKHRLIITPAANSYQIQLQLSLSPMSTQNAYVNA